MTQPRTRLVSLSDTPYYHCISRCVRRAFLCGEDRYTGKSYEHRRDWVVERLQTLSEVFAVDICSYAIMSNHFHLVVHIDAARVSTWTDEEVISRWRKLYRGPALIQRYCGGESLARAERAAVSSIVAEWRKRLANLSWYMRCLNEHIARRANAEDGCTGHFWEGRFRSQALLDEMAVITAMTYVDLNPIRARMADDLADSDKTSIQQRLVEVTHRRDEFSLPLMPFLGVENNEERFGLPFNVQDYIDLVDWSGRRAAPGKRGSMPANTPRLIVMLGIAVDEWLPSVTEMRTRFELVLGSPQRMREHASRRGGKFYRGYSQAKRLYSRLSTA